MQTRYRSSPNFEAAYNKLCSIKQVTVPLNISFADILSKAPGSIPTYFFDFSAQPVETSEASVEAVITAYNSKCQEFETTLNDLSQPGAPGITQETLDVTYQALSTLSQFVSIFLLEVAVEKKLAEDFAFYFNALLRVGYGIGTFYVGGMTGTGVVLLADVLAHELYSLINYAGEKPQVDKLIANHFEFYEKQLLLLQGHVTTHFSFMASDLNKILNALQYLRQQVTSEFSVVHAELADLKGTLVRLHQEGIYDQLNNDMQYLKDRSVFPENANPVNFQTNDYVKILIHCHGHALNLSYGSVFNLSETSPRETILASTHLESMFGALPKLARDAGYPGNVALSLPNPMEWARGTACYLQARILKPCAPINAGITENKRLNVTCKPFLVTSSM